MVGALDPSSTQFLHQSTLFPGPCDTSVAMNQRFSSLCKANSKGMVERCDLPAMWGYAIDQSLTPHLAKSSFSDYDIVSFVPLQFWTGLVMTS